MRAVKKSFYYIAFLFLIYLLNACGTAKNTKARRVYHAINTQYNIYYNGKLSFDESLKSLNEGYKESYTNQILMYPISAQPKDKTTTGGSFDRAIEKGNKAIKMHSIKTKPPKKPGWKNNPKQVAFQEQEEYNPFLKHCWLLTGEAQFYNADFLQASATFSYIARHYAGDEVMVATARLWQARCYSEMNWFYEAEDILGKLNTNGVPKNNLNQYAAVNADYLIKNKKVEDAIPYLRTAIKAEKNKRQRARMKYLLGQLYTDLELNSLAYKAFGEVAASNPPYDLEFAARIRQTEVFQGDNPRKVIKMLEKMAKSSKNKDYLDQVYYALGNIYLERRDTIRAIENYELGVENSTQEGMDKAILWIKLGDLYFEMKDYINAQPCFSGAVAIIQKEYKDYDRVAKLSATLDELVVHAEAIQLQDSLQTLARMPEAERLAAIDKIIADVTKAEEEAKKAAEKEPYLAAAESMGSGLDRPGTDIAAPAMPVAGGGGFYFYNPPMVSQGKTQFQRKWGRRTLEDDWRRRNKKVTTFEEQPKQEDAPPAIQAPAGDDGNPLSTDSLAAGLPENMSDDPKTREFYLQQIPLTEEDIEQSNLIIMDGMYHIGLIYKDNLEDFELAIEALEDLEERFPENEHLLDCYYEIYLMSIRLGNLELGDMYKAKMQARFPDEAYTIAISDPNYLNNIRSMDSVQSAVYEATYNNYLAEDTAAVRISYEEMSATYPLATLLPKFMFLNALTYVQKGDAEGFKEALKELVEKYPNADVAELAGEMLKGVLRGREMVQGGVKGMIWNLRFGSADGELSAEDSARVFTGENNMPSLVIMMYPSGRIDKNQLLYVVAAYNFGSFMVKELDLAFEESGEVHMLKVSGFNSFDEALQYYKMIYGKGGFASALSNEIAIIPISEDNLKILMHGKTLDEYVGFLEETFGNEAAELTARLNARIDAALMEEEEAQKEEASEEEAPEEAPVPVAQLPKDTIPVETIPEDTVSVVTVTADTIPTVEIPEITVPDSIPAIAPDIQEPQPKESPATDQTKKSVRQKQTKAVEEKPKSPAQLRKEKEQAYKARLKLKEKERKEKERAYKQKLRDREKARKAQKK